MIGGLLFRGCFIHHQLPYFLLKASWTYSRDEGWFLQQNTTLDGSLLPPYLSSKASSYGTWYASDILGNYRVAVSPHGYTTDLPALIRFIISIAIHKTVSHGIMCPDYYPLTLRWARPPPPPPVDERFSGRRRLERLLRRSR